MPDPIPVASSYTPAAGYHFLTPFYDFGIAVTTRERVWRDRLVHHMALAEGDVILDIGSGTGNLALAISRHSRDVHYLGIDPDEAATQIARSKTAQIVPPPEFRSEEHTSELQSLMRISYAVFCLKKKNK